MAWYRSKHWIKIYGVGHNNTSVRVVCVDWDGLCVGVWSDGLCVGVWSGGLCVGVWSDGLCVGSGQIVCVLVLVRLFVCWCLVRWCVLVSGEMVCVLSGEMLCVVHVLVSGQTVCVLVSGQMVCVLVSGQMVCVVHVLVSEMVQGALWSL